MKRKEFEKTVKYETLSQRNGVKKFMLKSYLNCLLRGGKRWKSLNIYGVSKVEGKAKPVVMKRIIDIQIKKRMKFMWHYLEEIVARGHWTLIDTKVKYYNHKGNLIKHTGNDNENVSEMVEITIKTTIFLRNPIEIKPLKRRKS